MGSAKCSKKGAFCNVEEMGLKGEKQVFPIGQSPEFGTDIE